MSEASFQIDPARARAILDDRTVRFAARSEKKADTEDRAFSALIISAGGERYAIPLSMLAGVLANRRIIPMPVKDKAIVGAIYERGGIWLVYDFAALAGRDSRAGDAGALVLLCGKDIRAAALIDSGTDIVRLKPQSFSEIGADNPHGAVAHFVNADGLLLVDESALWGRIGANKRRIS